MLQKYSKGHLISSDLILVAQVYKFIALYQQ